MTAVIEQFERTEEKTVEEKRMKIVQYHEITNVDMLQGYVENIIDDMNLYDTFRDAVMNTLDFDKMRREIEDHLTDDVRELEIDLQEKVDSPSPPSASPDMSDMNTEYDAYVRAFKKQYPTLVPTSYTDYKIQRDMRDQAKAAYDAKVDELAKMGIVYRSIRD